MSDQQAPAEPWTREHYGFADDVTELSTSESPASTRARTWSPKPFRRSASSGVAVSVAAAVIVASQGGHGRGR